MDNARRCRRHEDDRDHHAMRYLQYPRRQPAPSQPQRQQQHIGQEQQQDRIELLRVLRDEERPGLAPLDQQRPDQNRRHRIARYAQRQQRHQRAAGHGVV
jgi:hypothetical protein